MKSKRTLRSGAWFGRIDKDGFIHRSWMRGYPEDVFDGRPVIGICNTWSELTPCNAHFRDLADRVKRGVWEAGGFPLEFPVTSLGETNARPTAMLFRNLVSMDVEESIRANPIDGVVLLCGCDKTVPALIMGAASCDLPTLVLSGGPMLNGKFHGRDIGSGTDVWRFSEEVKAGTISLVEFREAEVCMSRSAGHCMTMGTASTMACMVEALGLGLPHNAAIPAPDARRWAMAHLAGRRIVEMVHEDLRISKILTREAFENAVRVNGAIGGSTNAVIHSLAIAGRSGIELSLSDWDDLGREVKTVVDLMPSGRFLMEDFYYAGGLPAVIRLLGENGMLHRDALTVNGKTIWENSQDAAQLERRSHPAAGQAAHRARRDRGVAGQSRARWRRTQAVRGLASSAAPPRSGRDLRKYRGLSQTHRGSRSRGGRKFHSCAQELRAVRLSRHGGGRQHGSAAQGAQARSQGHGPHLGRPHERDRLRYRGAACGSRSRDWRTSGAGAGRRYRSSWTWKPESSISMCRRKNWKRDAPSGASRNRR